MGAEAPLLEVSDGPRPAGQRRRPQPNHPPSVDRSGRSPWLKAMPEDRIDELDDDLFQLELGPPVLSAEPGKIDEDDEDSGSDQSEYDAYDEIPADESMHTAGVARSDRRLDARHYKTPSFAKEVLELFRREIKIPIWSDLPDGFDASNLSIHRVSGALTNAVFFISIPAECLLPDIVKPPTILLRVYGPASSSLISVRGQFNTRADARSVKASSTSFIPSRLSTTSDLAFSARSATDEQRSTLTVGH